MKKIFLFVLIFLPFNVYATKYYSEYRDYLMDSKEELKTSDILKREEVKYYNTYKEERIYGNYEAADYCDNYDQLDYKQGVFIKPYASNKMEDEYIQSSSSTLGDYIKEIDINTINKSVNIREFKFIYQGREVEYTVRRFGDDYHEIHDNDEDTYYTQTPEKSAIFVYLDQPYNIYDSKIEIVADGDIFLRLRFYYTDLTTVRSENYSITSKNLDWVSTDNTKEIKSIVGSYTDNNPKPYHRLTGNLYHCYQVNKVITNEYKETGDNLIENDYLIKYNYYIRDYIELEDIVDVKENTNLSDFIISTSNEDLEVEIINQINYERDGIYPIIFKIGDFEVLKEVNYTTPKFYNPPTVPIIPEDFFEYLEEDTEKIEDITNVDNNLNNITDEVIDNIIINNENIKEDIEPNYTIIFENTSPKIKKSKLKPKILVDKIKKHELLSTNSLKEQTTMLDDDKLDDKFYIYCILLVLMIILLLYRIIKHKMKTIVE